MFENREEYKYILDRLADADHTFIELLQRLLKGGNERKIGLDGEGLVISLKNPPVAFYWDPKDPRTAASCLAADGFYERLETSILSYFAARSKIIFDVGANVGYYAVVLGKCVPSQDSRLYAFEPIASTYHMLCKNLDLNNLKTAVIPVQLGLSAKDEILEINIPLKSGSSAASLRNLHPEEKSRVEKISLTSLDNFISSNFIPGLDLLKIDVEGAEKFTIQGGWDSINKFRPVIFAELLRKWSRAFDYHPDEVRRMLVELNYVCVGVSPALNIIDSIDENTQETNFLFIQNENLGFLSALKKIVNQ